MDVNFENAGWLKSLFKIFSYAYKKLWTDSLQEPEAMRANQSLWFITFSKYSPKIIEAAAFRAIEQYHFPPSIQQFKEIVDAMTRNDRMENNFKSLPPRRDPPSPLLQEYMKKNPPKPNDPFQELFAKYKGEELGAKVMQEIKRQLSKKNVQR